jgi:hypothetical protein
MGIDNFFQSASFDPSRLVRLGRLAKHEFVETVAHCDVEHQVPKFAIPALSLHSVAAQRGLVIVEEPLPGRSIGMLVLNRAAILVDRAKIAARCRPGTFVEGMVRSTVTHEIGHMALHRHLLHQGVRNEAMEEQARVYAAAFLLPRARLEVDATLLQLQELHDRRGEVPEFYLWQRLQVVANRFGVCRSLVVERLVKVGFLQRRRGTNRVWMASGGGDAEAQ